MPEAKRIFEFEDVDLSRVVVERQELDRYLRQRGRLAMLDGVLHEDVDGRLVIGYAAIRSDDWWARDHVPGRPMFPGALQIEVAAQLAAYDYAAHRVPGPVPDDTFVGFGGVDKVRFRSLIVPDCRLVMAVFLLKHSRRVFRYQAQGFVDRKLVFEGEILGVLV